jgi:putative SOS response-associated peptidase YedK
MCGRFALDTSPNKLAKNFHLASEVEFHSSWIIASSTKICSITADDKGSRNLRLMKWRLIPSWAKDASIGNKLTNARRESVAEKPSYRSAFKTRRCIIPASGFYEWRTEGKVKQPFYMSFKSGDPMAFAGIWETWGDAETCCIITTTPNSLMAPIHDSMPVILDEENWEQWLSLDERPVENVLPLIRPHDAEAMQAWPVSRDVNKAGARNDAGLIEAINE